MLPSPVDPHHRFALLLLLPYGPLDPILQPRLVHTSPSRAPLDALRDQLHSLHSTSALQFRGLDAQYQPLLVSPGQALLQVVDLPRARLVFRDWQAAYAELVKREDAALPASRP